MKSTQSGFTLIELVIVIVILGVLAALAVPRFVNLQDDAQAAGLNSNASAITSAMNINFAGCAVANHVPGAECKTVANCDDVTEVLTTPIDTAAYEVTSAALVGADGTSKSDCVLKQLATSNTKNFTAIKAGSNIPAP